MIANKLKVVFITQEEPFYIPKYMNAIFNKLGDELNVVKVYALPPNLNNSSFLKTVQHFFSYFGVIVFSYMVFLRAFYLMSDFLNRYLGRQGDFHSVKLVCNKFGIPFSEIENINSKSTLDELNSLKPDIIFSVACPQIFKEKIISIPSKGCLNIHSSLLPAYRGLNANFWVLANEEKTTGVTIHYINPGIDDGDILLQKKILLESRWSLNDLYLKVITAGSDAVSACLRLIHKERVTTQKNDLSKGSYFSFPGRADVKKFRSRGKRFFKYY